MFNQDRVGDTAGFLNHGFFAFLDENFVQYADHLAAVGMIDRAAAVARIGCGVELKDIIGRDQPSEGFFSRLCPDSCGITLGVIAEMMPRWVTACRPSTMPMG